jgi:anti-sigma-K factor RskA
VERGRGGLWQSVGFWRAAAAAAMVAAVALAVVNTVREVPQPAATAPLARAVTKLTFEDGTPAYLATLDTESGAVLIVPVPAAPDREGRVPELWLIPAGEGPRSLGVVTTDRAQTIAVPADLRRALTAGSTLAISLEPEGGSPQAVPTGPIVARGSITST